MEESYDCKGEVVSMSPKVCRGVIRCLEGPQEAGTPKVTLPTGVQGRRGGRQGARQRDCCFALGMVGRLGVVCVRMLPVGSYYLLFCCCCIPTELITRNPGKVSISFKFG